MLNNALSCINFKRYSAFDKKDACPFSLLHGFSGFLKAFPIEFREFNMSNSSSIVRINMVVPWLLLNKFFVVRKNPIASVDDSYFARFNLSCC